MEVVKILKKAKTLGLSLKLKKGNLVVKPKENINTDFLGILKENKIEIINYLKNYNEINRSSIITSFEKIKVYDRNLHEHIPLSFNQERLWFLDGLKGSVEYHMPFALKLSGDLDKKAFSMSFKEIVTRHEVLRTIIRAVDGVGHQEVLLPNDWELSFKDMTTDTSVLSEDLKLFLSAPFDLGSD